MKKWEHIVNKNKDGIFGKMFKLAKNQEEIEICEFIKDNSDKEGFEGSMKDIADIMGIDIFLVLRFFNKLFEHRLLLRINAQRHNFRE